MELDQVYTKINYKAYELDHHYGENIHILSSPWALSLLAKAGQAQTIQPEMNHLVSQLYAHLMSEVVNTIFPTKNDQLLTRMSRMHPDQAYYNGVVVDKETPVVCVGLARAGTFPSHIFFENLHYLIHPENIRQDHFYLNRETDSDGKVIGVNATGSKIGGGKDKAIVILPDPMGATGSTMVHAYEHYEKNVEGEVHAYACVNLIVTPEFIKKVKQSCPKMHIFCLRVDRGLSDAKTLSTQLGETENERGLNDIQYIVPGAGGIGEVLNNSFV